MKPHSSLMRLPLRLEGTLPPEKQWIEEFVTHIISADTPTETDIDLGLYLRFAEDGLSLCDPDGLLKPLRADFLEGEFRHKRKAGIGKNSLVGKALGVAKGHRRVLDATMGFAGDSWMFLCMGLEVVAVERSPVVYALVRDGIERARNDRQFSSWLGDRLQLVFADSSEYLQRLKTLPDVIYFDFMFNEEKSALPKKAMQLFKKLGLDDEREVEIVKYALTLKTPRVVVKRHSQSDPLLPSPRHSYQGRSIRYDLY